MFRYFSFIGYNAITLTPLEKKKLSWLFSIGFVVIFEVFQKYYCNYYIFNNILKNIF